MSLATYITVQEAVQRYSLDRELLTTWINRGRIQGGRLNGTFVLLEDDARRMAEQQVTKDDLRARVRHLEGKPISVNQAARKYGLLPSNISHWIKMGYIRVLVHAESRGAKKLIDESDIAYAMELTKIHPLSQGKRIFTSEFVPDWV